MRVLLITGVHGNELTPMLCLKQFQLSHMLTSQHNIKYIYSTNKRGIMQHIREVPTIRNSDLNRDWLEEKDYRETLESMIALSDIIIDIHSSPEISELLLIDRDRHSKFYVDYCRELNIPYLVRDFKESTIKRYCNELDKFGFTLELNGINVFDHKSAIIGANIINQILLNPPELINGCIPTSYEFATSSISLFSQCSGYIIYNQEFGSIDCEQSLYSIYDLELNKKLYDFIPNQHYPNLDKGLFLTKAETSYVNIGDPVGMIQPT